MSIINEKIKKIFIPKNKLNPFKLIAKN